MARRKTTKTKSEEFAEDDNVIETYNGIDEIETVLETVPEPIEVNNYDVMLPRSVSLYTNPLR